MTMQPQGDAAEQAGADAGAESEPPKPIDGFAEMSLATRQAAILERHGETGDDATERGGRHRPQTDASATGGDASGGDPPKDDSTTGAQGGETDADKAKVDGKPALDAPKTVEEIPDYLAKLNEQHEKETRDRLDNQKRSMLGEQREFAAAQRQKALLEELDTLPDDELAVRVKTDAEAAAALASRTTAGDPEVESRAILAVAARQTPQMFAAAKLIKDAGGPDLEAIMALGDGTPEFDAMRSSEGGVYEWFVKNAQTAFVEEFKKSPEYQAAISEARTQGKNDALGEIGQPAAAERGTPSRKGQEPLSDDPKVRALQRAAAATGTTDIDYELVGSGGRRRRRGE